ncbi:ABC transporter ATP-binding protein [Leptolyngbya sp. PCC 6406]|uniref:ABC transporter ATP-binding protein n=1 Tax=Leptolyngbya sp. PCC 6406 TaxID=1173264 RepID=UPI0002AC626A|nr:ABC transporter ATP-binding protein [Leptolyngbya sp. PCC 6406]
MQLAQGPTLTPPIPPSSVDPDWVLVAHELTKFYGRGSQRFEAVRQVSLNLQQGSVLAFLGPNGAGKTTTIKMVAGLVRPDRGWVRIVGEDPHRHAAALRHVGAVLEGNRNLYWRLTPEENLEYFGVLRGLSRRLARQRGAVLLQRFELETKAKIPVQKLSRGMQQKLAIAVALIHSPQLLLLDEPTLGLDVEASQTVKALVREIAAEGRAVILTTHQLDVAEELSDRVAIIRQGHIITEEPTADLIRQFSGSTYHLAVEGVVPVQQQQAIAKLGGTVTGSDITFAGSATALYDLLAALRPLPILSVQRDRADLTQVFLKLMQSPEIK